VKPSLKKITAACLAIWVSGASFTSPIVAHAHPGGDRPHDLNEAHVGHCHTHYDGHGHHGDPDHGSADGTKRHAKTLSAALLWHTHGSILGIDVVLPASSHGDEQEQRSRPVFESQLTMAGPATPAPVDCLSWNDYLFAAVSAPSFLGIVVPRFLDLSETGRDESPLCDTARHERSGVQLI
jgi:hypothetical protein